MYFNLCGSSAVKVTPNPRAGVIFLCIRLSFPCSHSLRHSVESLYFTGPCVSRGQSIFGAGASWRVSCWAFPWCGCAVSAAGSVCWNKEVETPHAWLVCAGMLGFIEVFQVEEPRVETLSKPWSPSKQRKEGVTFRGVEECGFCQRFHLQPLVPRAALHTGGTCGFSRWGEGQQQTILLKIFGWVTGVGEVVHNYCKDGGRQEPHPREKDLWQCCDLMYYIFILTSLGPIKPCYGIVFLQK